MFKLSGIIIALCLSVSAFAQNYTATTGFICQAYTYREGTLENAPYMFQNVQIEIDWVYCGPWSGSNSGTLNFDIFLNDGWHDLFTMNDSGNGCTIVTDFYNISYSMWNEAIDANGGGVLFRAVINDSFPGGVGCNWYSDPCYEVSVNFDYEPLEAPQSNFSIGGETACTEQNITITDLSAGTGLSYS
jgi:hypothetical protein